MAVLRFLFDECVSSSLAEIARLRGHDVASVAEIARASPDEAIFALAAHERRVLVTEDKGFGRAALRAGAVGCGLILLRLPK